MLATCQHDYEIDSLADAMEARDKAIDARAKELLQDGEECYPLEPLAAGMALEYMAEEAGATFRHLQKAKESADTNHPDCFEAHAVAFTRGMISLLYAYCSEQAQKQAEKEIRA